MKKLKVKEQGITLIALVVTIVVLLLLAGVSIAMLTGENGIIKRAQDAKENTRGGEVKERVDMAAIENEIKGTDSKTTKADMISELEGEGKLTDEEVEALQTTDIITIGDEEVLIPGGATISKILGEYEDVDKGIVIYIIPKDETPDWEADADTDGILDVQEDYDQFVWVPVPNAILDLSSEFDTLDEDGIIEKVQEQIDAEKYPMAIKTNETDYIGVLYQFTEEGGKVKVEPLINDVNGYTWTPLSDDDCREPAYLSNGSSADGSSYNNTNPKVSQDLLQQDFKTMVNKVSSQKGFWVGRYETSTMYGGSNGHDNSQDTTNKVKIVRGTTDGINTVDWYRMYAQQKSYRSLTEISSSRTSSMIWGSQWDQIMIWMKEVENEAKKSFYVLNALGMGNYGTDDDSDSDTTAPAPTGNLDNYKVKNVFDLAGNVNDWTLEAYRTSHRISRRRRLQRYQC